MTGSAAGATKIAIAGAGHAGVTLTCACMIRGTGPHRPARAVRAVIGQLRL